jgi:predicted ester cyclase
MANLFEGRPPDTPGYSPGSIPDRQEEFLDIIVRGNRLWASWLVRGTHLGPMLGLAPSGRQIEVLEVGQWRIEDGLIAEAWFFVDELALLRQIGQWPVGNL